MRTKERIELEIQCHSREDAHETWNGHVLPVEPTLVRCWIGVPNRSVKSSRERASSFGDGTGGAGAAECSCCERSLDGITFAVFERAGGGAATAADNPPPPEVPSTLSTFFCSCTNCAQGKWMVGEQESD